MNTLLETNPWLSAFIAVRYFVYLEVLFCLALLRLIGGRGWARLPALLTLLLCAAGIATVFAPAAGLAGGPIYVSAAQVMTKGGGMVALLVPSAVFALSWLMRGRRWRWIDWTHGALVLALLGLWTAIQF